MCVKRSKTRGACQVSNRKTKPKPSPCSRTPRRVQSWELRKRSGHREESSVLDRQGPPREIWSCVRLNFCTHLCSSVLSNKTLVSAMTISSILNDLFYYYSLNIFGYMTSINNLFSYSDLFLCIYKPNCVNLVFHKDHVYSDCTVLLIYLFNIPWYLRLYCLVIFYVVKKVDNYL